MTAARVHAARGPAGAGVLDLATGRWTVLNPADPAVQRLALKELSRLLGGVREPDGRDPLVVAGVVVMEVVRRRAGVWSIPARWAQVLDRWRTEHVALLARAQRCAGCGAAEDLSGRTVAARARQNPGWSALPTPTVRSAGRRLSLPSRSRGGCRTWWPSTPDRRSPTPTGKVSAQHGR
ncbi:hypothetical protein ACFC26_17570 [Kitasatospora purpeofusca]|uniref:hypothetical protein n=1 Tax=Kitasatospora purpeofusca TaxID=67352 RepID=UPI0035D540E3